MCLFPLPNTNYNSIAYKKGVTEFDCGACPECLQKRANLAVLTSVYEARAHSHNCMITLTYDNFLRDSKGDILRDSRGIPLETPVDPDLKVNVRDVQLFLKRLRKWYSTVSSEKIKYRVAAEYGSRTHRAHYHVLLFGVKFPDIHFYKKSKRGNIIYMSNILTRLWSHGICTVDSINVHSAIARYCTKYLAKNRSDKTFSLCSHSLGVSELIKDFNGRSYIIDGREYIIPRSVWQRYIVDKYSSLIPNLNCRYLNKIYNGDGFCINQAQYDENSVSRAVFRAVRDSDFVYSKYLSYWRFRGQSFDKRRLSVLNRIYLLPESKYHFYKVAALRVFDKRKVSPYPAPGSCCLSFYRKWQISNGVYSSSEINSFLTCRTPSRLNTASDTKNCSVPLFVCFKRDFHLPETILFREISDSPPNFVQPAQQLSIDF